VTSVLAAILFVVAAVAFALGLKLLARPTTARRGNLISAGGMLAATLGALVLAFDGGGAARPDSGPPPPSGAELAAELAAEGAAGGSPIDAAGGLAEAIGRIVPPVAGTPGSETPAPPAESPGFLDGPNRPMILWILAGLIVGTVVGLPAARFVKMTAMPEMVALFNGFGGIASLLVSWSSVHATWALLRESRRLPEETTGGAVAESVVAALTGVSLDPGTGFALAFATLVGGLTFGGSIVAWGKLSGRIPSAPLLLPNQRLATILLLGVCVLTGIVWAFNPGMMWLYLICLLVALVALGPAFVMPIGGADMPVVISLLNSYSGIAACAAGFALQQPLLIVTGALVGASGLILTRIMCLAMNRSLTHVLFSGFGSGDGATSGDGGTATAGGPAREATIRTPSEAFHALEAASSVVIVPGYGMAVAQAQHVVHDLARRMQANDTEVLFAIHPVAGRMPGHMSVLLAEADVPYEQLVDMEDINARMDGIDVAIVIGANDTVNPAARDDPDSPLAGMPIIEVDRARSVFILKRSLGSGYAGVDNPLFFADNAAMILGDAKKTVEALVAEFKDEG
jgi:NAD(P) transhydrogenase subunit beta